MAYSTWLQFIFIYLSVNQGLCESEDPKYIVAWSTGPENCKNYKNDKVLAENLKLTQKDPDNEGGPGVMCLEGSIEFVDDMEPNVLLNLMISKETPAGEDPMMASVMDLCQCIDDKDAPWAPMFEAIGIESCPVKKGEKAVSNLFIDLDFLEEIKKAEFCGEYGIQLTLQLPDETVLACYEMSASISEK